MSMKKRPAHKTRKQLQAERINQAQKQVDKANLVENPLEPLTQYHSFQPKDDSTIHITCYKVKNIPQDVFNWIFDLLERNMKSFYEKSDLGWHAETKRAELLEDNARYLIAKQNYVNIGFSHFRFDMDYGSDVLYCYELQLESPVRRKGIGTFFMKALDTIASKNQLQKIVLTVLKNNPSSLTFFQSLGFKADITSPSDSENVGYVILSKLANRS